MAADGFAGTMGVGAGAAGAFGVGSKPTDDRDVSIVIGSSIPGAHYGKWLPPPPRQIGGNGRIARRVAAGRNQEPLCTIGFHSALEKMAWKEIGT